MINMGQQFPTVSCIFFSAVPSICLAHILESVLVSQLLTQLVLTQHVQTEK